MSTVFIIEGVDGAGKSTLAKNLETLHATPENTTTHLHYGPPDLRKNVITTHIDPIYEWKKTAQHDDVLIVDRFHIGEMVYGPILREHNRMTDEQKDDIDHFLYEIGAVKLYVDPGISTIIDRVKERGDDLVSVDQIIEAYYLYETIIGDEEMPWTVVDLTTQMIIEDMARRRKMS